MKHIMTTDPAVAPAQARALLRQWYLATPRTPRVGPGAGGPPAALAGAPAGSSPAGVVLDLARAGSGELEARAWADDRAFLAWADGGGGASVIAAELKARDTRPSPRPACQPPASSGPLGLQCVHQGAAAAGSSEWCGAAGAARGGGGPRGGQPDAQRRGARGAAGRAGARAARGPVPAAAAGPDAARRSGLRPALRPAESRRRPRERRPRERQHEQGPEQPGAPAGLSGMVWPSSLCQRHRVAEGLLLQLYACESWWGGRCEERAPAAQLQSSVTALLRTCRGLCKAGRAKRGPGPASPGL